MSEGAIIGTVVGLALLVGISGGIGYAYETFDQSRMLRRYERNRLDYQLKLFDYDQKGNFVYPQF